MIIDPITNTYICSRCGKTFNLIDVNPEETNIPHICRANKIVKNMTDDELIKHIQKKINRKKNKN